MPRVRVPYLDGRRLARALVAGARAVALHREAIDRINVFPVADRDTGSNLAATLNRVSAAIAGTRERSVAAVARRAADEALLGARGNSGAIVAQALEGFAEAVRDDARLPAPAFGRAARAAARAARGAMAHPQEGTLLSVIDAWAGEAERAAAGGGWASAFLAARTAARAALARTPDQLAVLRKAGVVDAGAQGFVDFLEGVAAGYAVRGVAPPPAPADRVEARIREAKETLLFRWCTEVLLSGAGIDREALRRAAAPLGDSLAVVGSATRVRLHMHVNRPEDVFEVARRFGRVEETKAEDMRAQRDEAGGGRVRPAGRVAIVTDTACDLPDVFLEREEIALVPLRLIVGEETFLDRVTITPAEFHRRLRAEGITARTSQPPAADFREVYGALAGHGSPVVAIHVSGALSGTTSAARLAAASLGGRAGFAPVEVVDSKAVSVAQGLVVRAAAQAAARGEGLAEVVRAAEDAAARVRLLAAVPSLDSFVRGGRVTAGQRRLANLLGVVPLLTLDAAGRARAGGAARGFPRACVRLVEKSLNAASGVPAPVFAVAHADAPELAERIARELLAGRPGAEEYVVEVTPVLAAHTGPGAVAVATMGARPR
ncbi:MAG: DegV family EDD domain-containing protein [Acidobacteria bacterium]|nr:DegV family EDD domain-containing protein [Acidobacteriota bacterium]